MKGCGPGTTLGRARSSARRFFMITGFHGTHVTIGVIFLIAIARKVLARRFRDRPARLLHQPQGQLRDPSRSPACTGISSIWSGCSSSRSSICGERTWHRRATNGRAAATTTMPRPAASDQALPGGLGLAVRAQHLLLPGRLLSLCRACCAGRSIVLFMMLKAGLIVAVFMHMKWERLALVYAITAARGAVLVFVAIMVLSPDYTLLTRR